MSEKKARIIAVDFDGTLCEDEYPGIGAPNVPLLALLKDEAINGAKIILWTCRTGELLEQAAEWARRRGVPLAAVNENLPESMERFGGDTRKVFADVYVDDRARDVRSLMLELPGKGGGA
jgi:hypothetical protein